MERATTWRAGMALMVLLWVCGDRKALGEGQNPPAGNARPSAPASETLRWCEAPGRCSEEGPALADEGTQAILSPDRRFAFVWPAGGSPTRIDIYDALRRQRITRIVVDTAVAARSPSARVRWAAGDHVLLTWGAGTNAANGAVYNTNGVRLLDVAASAITVSPSVRFLATYPTLLADEPILVIYDLASGRQVARRVASENMAWAVEAIEWQAQELVARYRDSAGRMHDLHIALNASP